MGWWQVSTDTLASSRFVLSPLAETTAALKSLHRAEPAHPGEHAWLARHLPAYRARLAADPVTARLVATGLGRDWNADFLTPTPSGADEPRFEDELAAVRDTSPQAARADLEVSQGGPLPEPLRAADDLPACAARILRWVWTAAVRPDWPRRRRVIEADIAARTARLGRGGWSGALDGLRPDMRWLGDGRLRINAYDHPPRRLDVAQLMFVPVTPVTARRGWVAWQEPHRYAVVYACAGTLADTGRGAVPQALGRLLGPGRAAVLVLLDSPRSTTQLTALTGQGLGSVGRHLKVLLDAGLAERSRAGRSVLYFRTPAGEVLVNAQQPSGG
ncbi:ArsR family transcriptional regulator [Streptomyces triticagri]|uniref:ArsR family transcriptional regulator n=1 Tax=Streptomyces triticagri TaxID=2293568 RepID=A0A372LV31_9ACTN|nr:ArsR family transcriptional regulator [Streptomyces triticagri]RFU82230.1 ArsR family transcriptional regulator [Streptomyces triticagri]